MTKATQAVLAKALNLEVEALAQLAAEIVASLDGPSDADAEGPAALGIERRVAAIEQGAARLNAGMMPSGRIEPGLRRRSRPPSVFSPTRTMS